MKITSGSPNHTVPRHIRQLAYRVAEEYRLPESVELVWRESRTKARSSGHCRLFRRMVITGCAPITTDWKMEQRLVILHEFAHCITREGHTPRFWTRLVRLCQTYGIPKKFACEHETRSLRLTWNQLVRGDRTQDMPLAQRA